MHHRKVWRKCLRLQWLKNCTARAAVWFDLLTRFAFDPAKPRTPILWLCHPLLSRDLPSPLNRKSCSIAYTTCNTGPFSTPFKSAFSTAAARCLSLLGSTSRLVLSERERYSMARAETPPNAHGWSPLRYFYRLFFFLARRNVKTLTSPSLPLRSRRPLSRFSLTSFRVRNSKRQVVRPGENIPKITSQNLRDFPKKKSVKEFPHQSLFLIFKHRCDSFSISSWISILFLWFVCCAYIICTIFRHCLQSENLLIKCECCNCLGAFYSI